MMLMNSHAVADSSLFETHGRMLIECNPQNRIMAAVPRTVAVDGFDGSQDDVGTVQIVWKM